MIDAVKAEFPDLDFIYAIGGQISFDAIPTGWDKSFCIQFIEKDFDEIHFFGDRVQPGGNDHEIYIDKRVIGHEVADPEDTIKQLTELFLS